MIDNRKDGLRASWSVAGTHVAVAGAALVALVSLFARVPVWLACLRGLAAFAVALVVVRAAGAAMERRTKPATVKKA
ncbi:MAG: hypothetical protein ACK57N_00240 [Planctomycetia bacterium]|jgi:uncharacterized membrane protein